MSVSGITSTAGAVILAQTGGTNNTGGNGGQSIVDMLTNGQDLAQKIMAALLGLLGVVAIGWAAVMIFKKLSNERAQESWMKIIGLLFLGGLMLFGGWQTFSDLAKNAKGTVDDLGGTSSSSAPAFPATGNSGGIKPLL